MAKNFVSRGVTLDYKNSGSTVIAAGSVVAFSGMIGIAETDIPPGSVGALLTEGVVLLPKGNTDAFTQGEAVAWSDGDGKVVSMSATASAPAGQTEGEQAASATTSNPPAGIVWADAGSGTTVVQIKLNA